MRDLENTANIEKQHLQNQISLKQVELDKKTQEMEKRKWDVDYRTNEMIKNKGMQAEQQDQDHANEMERMEIELTNKNVDEHTLKYEGYANVKGMMHNKTVHGRTSKVTQDDLV